MTDIRFSVILVNWNTADMTIRAIESVYEDARDSEFAVEIFVVDNGSHDDSARRIRAALPAVEVLENDRNLGFARAVNRALWKATGEFILLLNTDARLRLGSLQAFLDAFRSDERIGICGGALVGTDGARQNCIAPFPSLATELINKSLLRLLSSRFQSKIPDGCEEPFEVDSVIGAGLVIRGKTLAALGGLDERFFFFFEETDWCLQCRRQGWKVMAVPGAVIEHGQGESSKPVLVDVRIEFYRSRYRYFQKNLGRLRTLVLFNGLLVKLVVENIGALFGLLAAFGKSEKRRNRFRVVRSILHWHLVGCPLTWGLEGRHLLPAGDSADR